MAPRVTEPQSLSRLLIQLKLKASSLKRSATTKAVLDCQRAAAAVEDHLAFLESGPPAMHLALSQASCGSEMISYSHIGFRSPLMMHLHVII
jgi:hypothetical protein